MGQFLYLLRATRLEMLTEGPTAEEQAVVAEHFQHLQRLTEAGTAILLGRTQNSDERTLGLVILNAASEEEARRLMESDPTVKKGVMMAELFPFRIALFNPDAA